MAPESISSPIKKTRSPKPIRVPMDNSLTRARKHRHSASWCGSPTEWDFEPSSGHISGEHAQSGLIPADHQLPASLLDQGLTSKGQPKRPMNAFLIFARWRRPILKEENPSLSTGEISTLLSQNWASMDAVTRDFYSSHALALKATFQSRYPAYEYTRRPNNTRKRGSRGGKTYISRRDSSSWKSPDDTSASTVLGGSALGLERMNPRNQDGSSGWNRNGYSIGETEQDSDTDTNKHDNDGSSSSQYSDHSQGNRPASSIHSELPTPQLPYYPLTTEYGPPNELSSSAPAYYKPEITSFSSMSAATSASATTHNNSSGTYGHSPHVFVSPYGWRANRSRPVSTSLMGSSPYSPSSSLSSFSPQLSVNGRLHGHGKVPVENGTNQTYTAATQDYPVPRASSRRPDALIEPSPASQSQQLATATSTADPSAPSFHSSALYQPSARDWSTDPFRRHSVQRARTGPLHALGFLKSEQQQPQQSSSYKWTESDSHHRPHSDPAVEDESRSEGGYRAGGSQAESRGWNSTYQEESTYPPAHAQSHLHSHSQSYTHSHFPSDQMHAYSPLPPLATTATSIEPSSTMSSAPIGVPSTSGLLKYSNNVYPSHSHSQSLISTSAPTTSLSPFTYSSYQQNTHHLQPLARTSALSAPKTEYPGSFVDQSSYHSSGSDTVHRVGPFDQDHMADRVRDSQRHSYQTDPQTHAKYESWSAGVGVEANARDRTPMMDSYYYES
ncbi:HMG-box transcription factor [Phaffia rhodozyma]|uniref:HMG-box transcription factor n=1 Tax=Phaffia rhodozyma TaxID=264483 RepID=A0A0F7SV28_PHARH|nr:HMG-box transcription factor [Phaffia rhodozyma]